MADKAWAITIEQFQGFVPSYWTNALPTVGNANQASAMTNIDLIDPNVLTQGPGLASLTNGTQAGAVTTLMRGILRSPIQTKGVWGIGGAKLYVIGATAVTNDASFPHTIDKAAVTSEDGEDVAYYQGNVFYSYNHSGSAGDIGKNTLDTTFDDDYMSTVPTGATTLVGGVPHQMIVGGDDILYIANGRYVAKFDGTTFVNQALDLPTNDVVTSLAWNNNQLYISTISMLPSNVGGNQIESSIYLWDTTSPSWSYQLKVYGNIGALYAKNGITYVWYKDATSSGVFKLGMVNGSAVRELASYTGALPLYYQVAEDQNYLIWNAGGLVWYWGASTSDLPTRIFQRADAGYATSGGITNAYLTPMVATTDGGSNYRFAQFSGYDTACTWKSILFNVSDGKSKSFIDRITIFTEPLSTGAALDTTLTYDYAKATLALGQIAYSATVNRTKFIVTKNKFPVENFRLDLSWANGSATNPVKVRKIVINGSFVEDL